MSHRRLASDLHDFLANSEDFNNVVCGDCVFSSRGYECPTCDDPFDNACPKHHAAHSFLADLVDLCEKFGIDSINC